MPLADVRVTPHDGFFARPGDALLHIPHARSTFGHDITDAFVAQYPQEMTCWQATYANELQPVIVAPTHTAPVRWILHLQATPTHLVSLHCLTSAIDAVVEVVRARQLRSLHVYAMEQYGLHGPIFAELLRSAFVGTGCQVTIFDATAA